MPDASHSDEISQRREQILSELVRANRAAVGIFIAVVLLALAIVFAAHNAQRHAAEANAAKAAAQQELWRAQLAQARATRQSVAMGRRVEAWKAVTNAASFKRDLELRNEAIAALATPDVRQIPLSRTFSPFKQAVAFDGSGDRYLETTPDGRVKLRRTSDNEILWTLSAEDSKNWYGGYFSRGSRWMFALYEDGRLALWDLRTYSRVKTFPGDQLWSYSISGDDRFMCLSTSDGVARRYSLPDWKETARIEGLSRDDDLTMNESGDRVAIRSATKPNITLIDWADPTKRTVCRQPTPAFAIEWHPKGALIATADTGQRIRIFDTASGEELRTLAGHHSQPIQLAFVAGRPWLLSMSWDGTSRLWDTVSGEELVRLPRYGDTTFMNSSNLRFGWCYENNSILELFQIEPSSIVRTIPELVQPADLQPYACALSPDDQFVAIASADGVRVLNAADSKPLTFYPAKNVTEPTYTTNGVLWFAASGKLYRVDPAADHPREIEGLVADRFRLNADGSVIAAIRGQTISVRRPTGTIKWEANQDQVETIAISSDGRWLASGTRVHIGMRVWDAQTGKLQWKNDLRQGAGVSFLPDSPLLFAATSEGCALWDAPTGKQIWERPRASESIMGIRNAVSPDGRLIAVANTWTEPMLIDPQTGAEIAKLQSPNPRYIASMTFSGTSRFLAIAYEDHSIQLWDLGQLRGQLASLGLDWGARPSSSAPQIPPQAPTRPRGLLALAAAGVVAAIAFGLMIFARHRRLLRGYLEIEAVAVERQQQLHSAEKELARGQKMTALGTLAAGVAHDFNNLLSVIRMANTGIARATRRPPEIADDLQDIESAVVDGKRIVQSMLGYTRDGVGPAEIFAIAPLLEETMRLLSRQFLSGLHLHLEVEPNLPDVLGYPGRLKQMLLNLVVNASEAMDGKGKLWIEARALSTISAELILRPSDADKFICISVHDSGPGMDRETRSRIFEPFFTTKTSATTRGTGLGLSLVYTMAEQDGLGLACQSAPGQGATFTIFFPVYAGAGSRSPTSAPAQSAHNA